MKGWFVGHPPHACLPPAAGIGFETAKALARQDYRVVLACRNKEKAEAARAKLQ